MGNNFQESKDAALAMVSAIEQGVLALNDTITKLNANAKQFAQQGLGAENQTAKIKELEGALKSLQNTVNSQGSKETSLWQKKLENIAKFQNSVVGLTAAEKKRHDKIVDYYTKQDALVKKDIAAEQARLNNIAKNQNAIQGLSEAEKKRHDKIVAYYDKEDALIKAQKTAREKGISGQVTAQMKEDANAIGRTSDSLKKLNEDYKEWEKTSARDAANSKKAVQNKLKEADAIQRNKEALQRQKAAYIEMNRPYNKLVEKQKEAKKVLQDLMTTQGKNSRATRRAQKEYDKLTNRINHANSATQKFTNTGLKGAMRGVRSLVSAFGLIGGATLFAGLIKNAFSLTKKLDSMRFSMEAVIKNTYELHQTTSFLRTTAQAYGADLVTITNRYIKFRAATQQAGLTAMATQRIFGTMTKAAGVLGLKKDELQGIFLALEQMVSKGKITTEELRRQLGERLPGAMDIMANSMGVTTRELDEMLKKGEVITKDVLPKFAEQVEIAFGLNTVDKVETLQAAVSRLTNAWTILVEDFGRDNYVSETLMRIIDGIASNLGTLVKWIYQAIKAWAIYKGIMISLTVASRAYVAVTTAMTIATALFKGGLRAAKIEMIALNVATKANPIGLLISALSLAIGLLISFSDELDGSAKAQRNLNKAIEDGDKWEAKQAAKRTAKMEKEIKEIRDRSQAQIDAAKTELEINKAKAKIIDEQIAYIEKKQRAVQQTIDDAAEDEDKYINVDEGGTRGLNPKTVTGVALPADYEPGPLTIMEKRGLEEVKATIKGYEQTWLDYEDIIGRLENDKGKLKTSDRRELKDVLQDLEDIEAERQKSIAPEAPDILDRIDVLNKEKEAWERLNKAKGTDEESKAKHELDKIYLQTNIDALKELTENTDLSLKMRLEANELLVVEEAKLAELIRDYGIETTKGGAESKKLIEKKFVKEKVAINLAGQERIKTITKTHIAAELEDLRLATQKMTTWQTNAITAERNRLISQGLSREKIEKKMLDFTKEIQREGLIHYLEMSKEKLIAARREAKAMGMYAKAASISDDIANLNAQISELNMPDSEDAKGIEAASNAMREFFNSFAGDVFSEAGLDTFNEMFNNFQLNEITGQWENMWTVMERAAEEGIEKFAFHFNQIAEMAQEAFNFISNLSNQGFEDEYENLERERDIKILFAGESASAQEEIDRQYEAKKRKIQIREAKAKKQQAIFNANIDGAQAIIGAWANPGYPGAIALTAVIAGLTVAKIAAISSQSVPEYFRGTMNAPEGWAMVDEKRPEVHTDRQGNVKSYGESKANMRYLESGDKIYKSRELHFKEELGGVLMDNDITAYNMNNSATPIVNVQRNSNESVVRELKSLKSAVNNKQTSVVNIDKNGFATSMRNGNTTTNKHNNILTLTGKGV